MSFNPRTRVGCDLVLRCHCFADHRFQSTHPRGVRRVKFRSFPMRFSMFQSTHPRGVRRRTQRHQRELRRFNPRTRVGCDDTDMYLYGLECRFQSTHPRGVRHASCFITLTYTDVSIHAPAWGATSARKDSRLPPSVSIHAPAWGATRMWNRRVKEDYVSIHAPAWGATRDYFTTARPWPQFQSTHPRGVRPAGHKDCHRSRDGRRKRFNPRTRVGCDAISTAITLTPLCFNPRTRVGCDVAFLPAHRGAERFNPRTRVGCDLGASPRSSGSTCFNPRTRVGCDNLQCLSFLYNDCFNPRTRVGCDRRQAGLTCLLYRFQSTHPRGVRLHVPGHGDLVPLVSIHAPAWGATWTPTTSTASSVCFNPRTRVGCDRK